MDSSKSKNFRSDLKIIVVGSTGTGKTSFVNQWTKNIFTESYKATIVSEFGHKIYEHKGQLYRIQLWDLAGQDKNVCVTKIFCKDAHGCVILSDITNKKSLNETIKWKSTIDETSKFLDNSSIPSILIENKVDMLTEEEAKSTLSASQEFAKKNQFIGHFRTSAKNGMNINESMDYLIRTIIQRMEDYCKDGKHNMDWDKKSIVIQQDRYEISPDDFNKRKSCC